MQVSQPTVKRYWLSERTGQTKPAEIYSRHTARRISKLYDWNKPGVKDMLGDCE
jgi:hypothetical protein